MRFHRFQWEDERLIDFDRLYRLSRWCWISLYLLLSLGWVCCACWMLTYEMFPGGGPIISLFRFRSRSLAMLWMILTGVPSCQNTQARVSHLVLLRLKLLVPVTTFPGKVPPPVYSQHCLLPSVKSPELQPSVCALNHLINRSASIDTESEDKLAISGRTPGMNLPVQSSSSCH